MSKGTKMVRWCTRSVRGGRGRKNIRGMRLDEPYQAIAISVKVAPQRMMKVELNCLAWSLKSWWNDFWVQEPRSVHPIIGQDFYTPSPKMEGSNFIPVRSQHHHSWTKRRQSEVTSQHMIASISFCFRHEELLPWFSLLVRYKLCRMVRNGYLFVSREPSCTNKVQAEESTAKVWLLKHRNWHEEDLIHQETTQPFRFSAAGLFASSSVLHCMLSNVACSA